MKVSKFEVELGVNCGVTNQSCAKPPETFSYLTYAAWDPVLEILVVCQFWILPKPFAPIKETHPFGGNVFSNLSGNWANKKNGHAKKKITFLMK